MNYEEALDYISSNYYMGIRLGLERIEKLLNHMGDPQDKLKFIHLAGTNGKGSTSNMISGVLQESEYRVGLFISPYLEEFTERIQINGEHIPKESLARITSFVKDCTDKVIADGYECPSEFEVVTAIGLQYFYEEKVDIVVLEVGMGGRFDATNIIKTPELAIITSIAKDHVDYLGHNIEEIAFEKAGIIKENGQVVLYPQGDAIKNQMNSICNERKASLHLANIKKLKLNRASLQGQELSYEGGQYLDKFDFTLSLLGEHQIKNCITALTALEVLISKGYNIDEKKIQRGLAKVQFPGRFELLSAEPTVIIDGAHNENGIDALVSTVNKYFKRKVTLVFGVLADKDFDPMIKKLNTIANKIYTVSPNSDRAMSSAELYEKITALTPDLDVKSLATTKEAVRIAKEASKNDVFIFVGSLYMIGEARTMFYNIV